MTQKQNDRLVILALLLGAVVVAISGISARHRGDQLESQIAELHGIHDARLRAALPAGYLVQSGDGGPVVAPPGLVPERLTALGPGECAYTTGAYEDPDDAAMAYVEAAAMISRRRFGSFDVPVCRDAAGYVVGESRWALASSPYVAGDPGYIHARRATP